MNIVNLYDINKNELFIWKNKAENLKEHTIIKLMLIGKNI